MEDGKMGFGSIISAMLGGFACRIYAGGMALWIGSEAMKPLAHVAEAIRHLP